MEWRNQSDVEINGLDDRLEISVRTRTGMLEGILFAGLSVFAVLLFGKAMPIVGLLIAAVAVIAFVNVMRDRGGEARLTVHSDAFVIENSRGSCQSVSVDDIYGIGYFAGGEDEPTGLYAFRPLSRICLAAGIDEAESQRIKSAIESKFPEMRFGKEPITSLFGDPEIITLRLSRSAASGPEPPRA